MADVTQILRRIEEGDRDAADELLPVLYDELRRLAAHKLAGERPGQTLQPTALVHEAYLRLVGGSEAGDPGWEGRGHFFGAAAEAMRRILVDNARRKAGGKHGGGHRRVDLDAVEVVAEPPGTELLALDEALARLSVEDPIKAELVKLRHFAGLTLEQAAQAVGISLSTADRYWAYARAWLYDQVTRGDRDQES